MAETISQRVNALFASYVATEAEQTRLSAIGTEEAGKQADALGTPALAIRDEVFAIRDRSACPDLVAARLLLDLMLSHPWPPTSETEWGDDAEVALPMLEILADRVTGAVRIEVRRVLATIGVDVPAQQADPFVERMRRYHADVEAYNNSGRDDDADPWHAFESELEAGAIGIGSAAGAAMALRQVMALDAVGCTESQTLINRTIGFLDAASLTAMPTAPDPLLALVTEYRSNYDAAFAAWEASRDDAVDEAAAATWKPLWDRLCDNPPAATSLAGVQAALQLVHSEAEKDTGSLSSLTPSLTGAALAYFGRA